MKPLHAFVASLLIILVAVASINIIHNNAGETDDKQHTIRLGIVFGDEKPGYASLKITANYDIQVYRDGKLIATRHKDNDPITIQWYRLVADMMFGFIRDGAVKWLDTGGNQRSWIDTERCGMNPKTYIVLGDGIGTPTRNDYKMISEKIKDIATMSVEDDNENTRYIILYTKSFTITEAFTLREVGLELYLDINTNPGSSVVSKVYLLVAHDSVSPSVDLEKDDVVTITYRIIVPYNINGVFTRWFYNALVNYLLGYKGTTGTALTLKDESGGSYSIDTATDNEYQSYCGVDIEGEYTYVEIGTGTSTINPLFETYNLGSRIKRIRIDDPQFINEINETETFTIHYVISTSFTEPVTISELGISYYTDGNPSYGSIARYFLWLYWVLAEPVNVDAGDGLRIEITIEIPYT